MSTWELTIDNKVNKSTTVYVMEVDTLGVVKTPTDLWGLVVGDAEPWKTNLDKRFYHSIIFGASTDFPAICKAITPSSNTEKLIVSKDTTALQVWTYSDGIWTAKDNITKGIADRATVAIPSFEAKKK